MLRCMRTTLTLDEDVAAMVESLRRERDLSLKETINSLLRQALRENAKRNARRPRYETKSADLGACLVDTVDDIAGVLSEVEGDAHA